MKVLSLGAGVQSSTLLLMACRRQIEKPAVAIFADTGWEEPRTYLHLEFLKKEAAASGIPVLVVSNGNIRDDLLNAAELKSRFYQPPLFMRRNGKLGMGRRHCTEHYKLRSVYKKIRELLDVGPRARISQDAVELWVGISLDEYQRMATSRNKWVNNTWPLIDLRKDPVTWKDAVEVDEIIRTGRPDGEQFLHRSGRPLAEVDFRTPEEKGQLTFPFYQAERYEFFTKLNIWLPEGGE